jgi:hypothetical protein
MENSNTDIYKEMASLCLKLYSDCIKYKKQKEKEKEKYKELDCDKFYNNFEYFSLRSQDEQSN